MHYKVFDFVLIILHFTNQTCTINIETNFLENTFRNLTSLKQISAKTIFFFFPKEIKKEDLLKSHDIWDIFNISSYNQ